MRHLKMIYEVGSVEKEAKCQAAGAVLEDITFPAEKNKDTEQQDHEETIVRVNEQGQVEGDRNHPPIKDGGIIDKSNELNSSENKEEAKPVITIDKFDDEGLNQKLEELNSEVLEDHAHANSPEVSDE